jgi:hypothetical protein
MSGLCKWLAQQFAELRKPDKVTLDLKSMPLPASHAQSMLPASHHAAMLSRRTVLVLKCACMRMQAASLLHWALLPAIMLYYMLSRSTVLVLKCACSI